MRSVAAKMATEDGDAGCYQRHQSEQAPPCRIAGRYCLVFIAPLTERSRGLPAYPQREFDDYLNCGRLEHGFLRGRYEFRHAEHLVPFS